MMVLYESNFRMTAVTPVILSERRTVTIVFNCTVNVGRKLETNILKFSH